MVKTSWFSIGCSLIFSIYNKKKGYLSEFILWFLRMMLMNPKNHLDNHLGQFNCPTLVFTFWNLEPVGKDRVYINVVLVLGKCQVWIWVLGIEDRGPY